MCKNGEDDVYKDGCNGNQYINPQHYPLSIITNYDALALEL